MISHSHSFLSLLTSVFSSFHSFSLSKNLFSAVLPRLFIIHAHTVCPPLDVSHIHFRFFRSCVFLFLFRLCCFSVVFLFNLNSTPLSLSLLNHLSNPFLSPSLLPPPVCPFLSSLRLWTIWSRGWRRRASRSVFVRVSSPTRLSLSRTSRCFD